LGAAIDRRPVGWVSEGFGSSLQGTDMPPS
jgi:hypothetical protein